MPPNLNEVSLGTFHADQRTIDLVTRVLQSGRLSYGPVSQNFETIFAMHHDSTYGVLSNSGTSSLVVAIQALADKYNWNPFMTEIIVPSVTFVATVNAVLHNGCKPVFIDVDPVYYDMDPDKLEKFLREREQFRGEAPRAVIVANLFGQPASLARVREICNRRGLIMIEDSCEAMFVDHYEKSVGSWGDVGIFSMYMAHIIAAGVGGIAITKDEDLAQRMRSLVNHGIDLKGLPGGEHYDSSWLARKFKFTSAGHSFRTTEIESAIATVQLERWNSILDGRQRSADHYLRSLAPLDGKCLQLPMTRKDSDHSWMVFPILVINEEKYGLMEHLIKNKVECRDMLPLVNQPYLRHIVNEADFPVAQMINYHGFYIGCHQDLSPYQIERACTIIHEYFDGKSYYGASDTTTK